VRADFVSRPRQVGAAGVCRSVIRALERNDEHVAVGGQRLVERFHRRDAVVDACIVDDRRVERRDEREATEQGSIERVNRRRALAMFVRRTIKTRT
jgi:hypothetical protein